MKYLTFPTSSETWNITECAQNVFSVMTDDRYQVLIGIVDMMGRHLFLAQRYDQRREYGCVLFFDTGGSSVMAYNSGGSWTVKQL